MKVLDASVFANTSLGGEGEITVRLSLQFSTEENILETLESVTEFFGVSKLGGEPVSTPEPSPEAEPAKPRRRRRANKEELEPSPEAEPEPTKPRRRRRAKKEELAKSTGPTKEDVAKAAATAAEKLGTKITGQIIADYSETGKLDDIPEDKREEFIKEVEFELSDD